MTHGTKFVGPVYVGVDDGSQFPARGIAPVTQRISVSAIGRGLARKLPACDIIGFRYNVETAGTSACNILVGTSADDDQYANAKSVSAVGGYDLTSVSAAAMLGVAEDSQVMVQVCAQGDTSTIGLGSLYVTYLPRPRE
jgi:hypothetical protein